VVIRLIMRPVEDEGNYIQITP